MKEKYRDKKFYKKTKIVLDKILKVVNEYEEQKIVLTLRQLYYQLVGRGFIPNTDKSYTKTARILKDARYTGLVDWDSIEDRARVTTYPSEWENIEDILETTKTSYRLPRWEGQEFYMELITEKDALSSVFSGISHDYHIQFSVNRGYDSTSAVYLLSKRILRHKDQKTIILYVGDHDPSGVDMSHDIETRLKEFTNDVVCFDMIPVALTMEQVREYSLPPNPAKETDSRAAKYIEEFGRESWEVDALRPEVLISLVEKAILEYLDVDMMNAIITKENREREKLGYVAKNFDALTEDYEEEKR